MLDSLSVSLAGLASLASLASWRRPLPGMASPPNHASSSLKVEEGCWGLRSLGRHFLGIEHILGFGGPSTNLLLALVRVPRVQEGKIARALRCASLFAIRQKCCLLRVVTFLLNIVFSCVT